MTGDQPLGAVATSGPDGPDYIEIETPRRGEENRLEVHFDKTDSPAHESSSKQTTTADGKLVSFSELFSFADSRDKLLMFAGTLGGLAAGLAQPLQIVLFGDMINSFNPNEMANANVDDMRDDINRVSRNFVFLGIGVLIAGFVQVACWSITGSRQAKRIRSAYVSAIITKEIGWFDVNEPMQLATRVADSTVTIQEGMSRKVGDGLQFFSMAVSGITIGMVKGWELALILLAFTPFIALTAFLAQSGIESYGKAGAIAQESLSNIRTVHMFNSIDHFVKKYEDALGLSTKAGIKKGFAVGWGTGLMFFTVFCTYACGLYYGALKVANDNLDGNTCTGGGCYDGGRVLTVFFSIIMGAMALGQAGPSAQAIFSARAAAFDVFSVIKRASLIDPLSDDG
ncbi:hypothetical protein PybrP1_003840, partial [[Pythium] brassicae (nom. inval.)]